MVIALYYYSLLLHYKSLLNNKYTNINSHRIKIIPEIVCPYTKAKIILMAFSKRPVNNTTSSTDSIIETSFS
ncbi:MAG: hypothetical protein ACTSYD_14770 [Candidatus Heimdallarchaeaceae archaeon]